MSEYNIKAITKIVAGSSTVQELLEPTSGTHVKVISVQATCSLDKKVVEVEVYFGAGTNIDTTPAKAIARGACSMDETAGTAANTVSRGYEIVWPKGEGPVGAKDEVVSCRGDQANDYTVTMIYKELTPAG